MPHVNSCAILWRGDNDFGTSAVHIFSCFPNILHLFSLDEIFGTCIVLPLQCMLVMFTHVHMCAAVFEFKTFSLMLLKLHIPHVRAHIQQVKDEMSTSGHLEGHVLDA